MAADLKGVLTTLSNALPQGLDGGRIAQWMLRDGVSYETVRADIVAAMNAVNLEELSTWGDMIYVSEADHFEYSMGGSINKMPRLTDSDRPQPRKGLTSGHMVDLWKVGDAIGGTDDYFMDARREVIDSTVAQILQAGRNTFEVDLLTRFFSNAENALGSGYDVGFADASSTVTFAPLAWGGKTFSTSHQHYTGYDSGSSKTLADVLDGLALNLIEHGHQPPFIGLVSEADVVTIRALTNYVQPVDVGIDWDRGGLTSGGLYREDGQQVAIPATGGRYIGRYNSAYGIILLRATNRLTTGYVGAYKSYGVNDPRNPIVIRIHPQVGFGYYIAEIPNYTTTWPVKAIEVYNRYGVSANGASGARARTAGAAGLLVSGGTYVSPTIAA